MTQNTPRKNTRNTAIEALRFFSIIQIAIYHLEGNTLYSGYLGVEFFFILSGIFIYINAIKENSPGIIKYTKHKLSKFYFNYVISVIIAYIVFYKEVIICANQNILSPVFKFISEVLMLQSVGTFVVGMNGPLWFFSVLIYGGAIIYGLTKYKTKDCIRWIFPLIVLLFLTFVFNYGSTANMTLWSGIGPFPFTMVRGMVEIAFGVLIGYLCFNYNDAITANRELINIVSVASLILYIIIVFCNDSKAAYSFIFIPGMIAATFCKDSWFCKIFRGNIWLWLGALSFDIYIIHPIFEGIVNHILIDEFGMSFLSVFFIYLILLIPVAYIFNIFCKFIFKALSLEKCSIFV